MKSKIQRNFPNEVFLARNICDSNKYMYMYVTLGGGGRGGGEREEEGGGANLFILVMMTLPQLISVTFSPSENVWASAPSSRTRDEYQKIGTHKCT